MALRLPGLQRHLPIRRLLNTPRPASAAPPGKDSRRGAACVPGGATLTRPTTPFTYQKATQHPRPGKRRAAGQGQRARSRLCAGWRYALPGLQRHLPIRRLLNTPDPASAAGQRQQARSRLCAGWRLRLTRPTTPFTYQKATQHPRPGKRRRARTAGAEPLVCRVALRLPGLQRHLPFRRLLNTPGPASAAGQGQQARCRFCAGWRLRLTRPGVRATCR